MSVGDQISECSLSDIESYAVTTKKLISGVPPVFRLDALKKRRWVSVAVEDELMIEEASRIVNACTTYDYVAGWGVEIPWSPGDWAPAAHRFTLSAKTLCFLSKEAYIGSCYFICEELGRFAIASSGDMYWMICGSKDFVQTAIGVPIESQIKKFNKLLEKYTGLSSLEKNRLNLAQSVAIASCNPDFT